MGGFECWNCGYDLEGLGAGAVVVRCPECGCKCARGVVRTEIGSGVGWAVFLAVSAAGWLGLMLVSVVLGERGHGGAAIGAGVVFVFGVVYLAWRMLARERVLRDRLMVVGFVGFVAAGFAVIAVGFGVEIGRGVGV